MDAHARRHLLYWIDRRRMERHGCSMEGPLELGGKRRADRPCIIVCSSHYLRRFVLGEDYFIIAEVLVHRAPDSIIGHAFFTAGVHDPVKGVLNRLSLACHGYKLKQHPVYCFDMHEAPCLRVVCTYNDRTAEWHCSPRLHAKPFLDACLRSRAGRSNEISPALRKISQCKT